MKGFAVLITLIALSSCKALETGAPPPVAGSISERVFQRRDVSGGRVFTVRLRATSRVTPAMLDLLEKRLTIRRVDATKPEDLRFWREPPMTLQAERAEVQVELTPAEDAIDVRSYVYSWPEVFQISRPGVLETVPAYRDVQLKATRGDEGIGLIRQALEAPRTVRGRIRCHGDATQQIAVVVAGQKTQAQPDGIFEIIGGFTGIPTRVYVAYDANIRLSLLLSPPRPRLQVFNDFHDTRNESVDQDPTVTGDVADFGDVNLSGSDCVLWNLGVRALTHYFQTLGTVPPAGELRVKRWEAVYISAGAAPHTFYDYIVAPTDLAKHAGRTRAFFHEFGHSIRHVADGGESHWHWDNVKYIYARDHNGSQVTNKSFVFNEGWAHFWATAVLGGVHPLDPNVPGAAFLDWNEELIGERLRLMSVSVGPGFMVRVLLSNPGTIHTLRDFEERYCAAVGPSTRNPFCKDGVPTRAAPPSCPPGFTDDGATCRLNNVLAKPSFGRGVGVPPNSCRPDQEYDAGLCYPKCPAGFGGVGPVCWQSCPAGYDDDGATCRRNANITGADNSACPWYDKCGLTFAGGCSVCPDGFHNDGCTCRIDVHIFAKDNQGRGVGAIPDGCRAGMQYDTGLCYPPCGAGFSGVGPVCWGQCPTDFADHGATCYRAPNIFSDD